MATASWPTGAASCIASVVPAHHRRPTDRVMHDPPAVYQARSWSASHRWTSRCQLTIRSSSSRSIVAAFSCRVGSRPAAEFFAQWHKAQRVLPQPWWSLPPLPCRWRRVMSSSRKAGRSPPLARRCRPDQGGANNDLSQTRWAHTHRSHEHEDSPPADGDSTAFWVCRPAVARGRVSGEPAGGIASSPCCPRT